MNDVSYKISLRKYLNDYDLLNKYNISNIQNLPTLKKLYLGSKVINFKAEHLSKKKGIDYDSQIISGLFFYLFFGKMPKISYKVAGHFGSAKMREEGGEYYIRVDISDIEQMSSFFALAKMETGNLREKISVDKIKVHKNSINNSKISYNLTFPANAFFELNDFIKYNTDDINLSKLSLDMILVFNKIPKDVHPGNLLKNAFFFLIEI